MNRNLIRDISSLPLPVIMMFAEDLGNGSDDIKDLFELEMMFLEEVIDKDVNASNVFIAMIEVKESLRERWAKYLESVSDAHNV